MTSATGFAVDPVRRRSAPRPVLRLAAEGHDDFEIAGGFERSAAVTARGIAMARPPRSACPTPEPELGAQRGRGMRS